MWDETLCHDGEPPEVRFGERAFEIVLAQDCAAGITTTTWFERHGAQAVTAIPEYWPADYRALVERRIAAIRRSRDLALIERPECKRRWSQTDWNTLERAALENWLLDRLEAADLWPRDAHPAPKLRSARELADALADDENFRRALDLYAGTGSDAHATVAAGSVWSSARRTFSSSARASADSRAKRSLGAGCALRGQRSAASSRSSSPGPSAARSSVFQSACDRRRLPWGRSIRARSRERWMAAMRFSTKARYSAGQCAGTAVTACAPWRLNQVVARDTSRTI